MDELICSFAPLLGARGIAAMDIEEGEGESGDAAAGHPNLPSIPVDPIISFVGVPCLYPAGGSSIGTMSEVDVIALSDKLEKSESRVARLQDQVRAFKEIVERLQGQNKALKEIVVEQQELIRVNIDGSGGSSSEEGKSSRHGTIKTETTPKSLTKRKRPCDEDIYPRPALDARYLTHQHVDRDVHAALRPHEDQTGLMDDHVPSSSPLRWRTELRPRNTRRPGLSTRSNPHKKVSNMTKHLTKVYNARTGVQETPPEIWALSPLD